MLRKESLGLGITIHESEYQLELQPRTEAHEADHHHEKLGSGNFSGINSSYLAVR